MTIIIFRKEEGIGTRSQSHIDNSSGEYINLRWYISRIINEIRNDLFFQKGWRKGDQRLKVRQHERYCYNEYKNDTVFRVQGSSSPA